MIFSQLSKPNAAITESSELAKLMGSGYGSDTGLSVNADSAMRSSAYYACVMVIAETVAQLPLLLYQRIGDRKEKATAQRLYSLLHDMPNDFQTSFDWRLTKTVSIINHGVGYSFINRSINGEILELLPMMADKVKIKQNKDWSIQYEFTDSSGNKIPLKSNQVFRITGRSLDGFTGLSPIEFHRQTIGLSLAADRHSALNFKNGARHSGILENPGHFSSQEVARRVRDSWDEATTGDNVGKTALLEDGLAWKQVGMSNRDAQYIEVRKMQIEEIARIFNVPPHKIGHLDKATNNNIEHQGLEFVVDTMMPWLKRWEQSISRDILGRDQAKTFFAEFNVEGLLRGDSAGRAEFYSKAVGGPWMSANEARGKENMNPINGLDDVLKPMNMSPSGEVENE